MKERIKMDKKIIQRLNAICSWVEVYAPKVTRILSDVFYSNFDAQAEKLEREGVPDIYINAKVFDIIKSENALNKAKERIKQNLISSDKSQDNSVIYTAITHFKKTNE